jgi:hypothetical protein
VRHFRILATILTGSHGPATVVFASDDYHDHCLVAPNILYAAQVSIRFERLPPLVIQINATYIYNSLQCDLLELHL